MANLAEFIQTEDSNMYSNEQSFEGDRHLAVMGTTPGLLARREQDQDLSLTSMPISNGGDSLQVIHDDVRGSVL